jgi:dTMP kinase
VKGKLVVFEGPDGIGKSTLVQNTKAFLERAQVSAEEVSFPGKTSGTLGHLVNEVHHFPGRFGLGSIDPLGLQTLHVAAHVDTIATIIKPALLSGRMVILDRFWWSTWVYGASAGVAPVLLDALVAVEKLVWGEFVPSVVFLLTRTCALRAEQTQQDFVTLSRLYDTLADRESLHHPVIQVADQDLRRSLETVTESIVGLF